jgi:hypothetical protein
MKTRAGSGVQLHSCLNLTLDRSGQSHDPAFSRPLKEPQYQSNRRLRGPQQGFRRRDKCLAAARTRIPSHLAHSLVATLHPPPRPRKSWTNFLYPAFHTLHSSDTARFDQPHNVWCRVQITKVLLMQIFSAPFALGPDVLHGAQFRNTPLMFLHLTASEAAFGETALKSK